MDVPEVRRRLRGAIESARREAGERRARAAEAGRAYDTFLESVAVPAVQLLQKALAAEGHRFAVHTPSGSVRLVPEGSSSDLLEIALDDTVDPPEVVVRAHYGRGRRAVSTETTLRSGAAIADLRDEDVIQFLVDRLGPFLSR